VKQVTEASERTEPVPRAQLLPPGWVWTTLGEVCLVNPSTIAGPLGDDVPVSFVPMAAVETATGRVDASRVRPYSEVARGYTRFSEGDVLFAKITPCMENGKIAVARGLTNGAGCGSTEFHVLRPLGHVSSELVMYYLLQDNFRKEARRHMAGTAGQLRVPAWFVSEAPFPLPPLQEQHRIVAEIDKHLTRLDAAVASLQRARANLKRYRASVLKAACEGHLVPTEAELARHEGRGYEPASVLLERILEERRARWVAHGKRRGKYRESQPLDTSNLPALPEGWVWATVEQIGSVGSGHTPKGVAGYITPSGEIPWFRVGDMNLPGNERFMRNGTAFVSSTDAGLLGLRAFPPGTIVFPKRGGAIVTNKKRQLALPSALDLNTMGIVPSPLVAAYVWWWFQTVPLVALHDGSNVPQINHDDIAPLLVPLPPLSEQRRIVAEVERLLAVIQAAAEMLGANLQRAERLRQVVLRRALEGKLVPQDPTDVPASVLLERIRAEEEHAGRNTEKARRKVSRRQKAELEGPAGA